MGSDVINAEDVSVAEGGEGSETSERTASCVAGLDLFRHLPDALLLVDPGSGALLDANPAALKRFGPVGERTFASLTGRDPAGERRRLERAARRGSARFVASLWTLEGTWPARLRATAVPGEHGPLVLLTIRDATGLLRRAEDRERLARLESARSAVGRLRHDLGNALTASSANVDVAQDLVAAGDLLSLQEVLDDVRAALRNADALVRRLSEAPNDGPPTGSGVALGALLPRVVGLHLRGSAVRGRIDADPGLPLVQGDAEQLHRVFANIVRNARQAMATTGTLSLRVHAAPGADGRPGVRVDLRDDAPGVPPLLADSLFSPGVSGRPGGQGLGLASCRHILSATGGSIDLERAGGPGACFRVWLPVADGASLPLG